MKNTMQDRHLCCPLTVSLAQQWGPHFFISRIATGNHSVQPQGEHWPPFRYASSRVFWSCPTSICAEQASWSQATRVKAVTIKILSEKSVDDLSTVPFLKKTAINVFAIIFFLRLSLNFMANVFQLNSGSQKFLLECTQNWCDRCLKVW